MFRVAGVATRRQTALMTLEDTIDAIDWSAVRSQLLETGVGETGRILSVRDCRALRAAYGRSDLFRKKIVMARHGFGAGEYQYFKNPLPPIVEVIRRRCHERLAPLANEMAELLNTPRRWPETLEELSALCAEAGQASPTPLLLRYGPGDYNCLHQDIYGEIAFPLQLAIQLSDPMTEFEGGAFVAVENRPRMQSRATAVSPAIGAGVVFATREKPRRGAKGWSRSTLRHGVSTVTRGERYTLGVIFHDAA
ncbi:MAG: 2OG-Fe(II) oxygenase [Pseudomonadota bacterium]